MHRRSQSSGLKVRTLTKLIKPSCDNRRSVRSRSLSIEQLEHRQMLSGDTPPSPLATVWSGDFLTAVEASHAAPPTLSTSSTTASAGAVSSGTPTNAVAAIDWIVQFKAAATANIATAAQVAALLPQGGVQFQLVEGLGAVGEVLVRSQGASAASASAALRADVHVAAEEMDSAKQTNSVASITPNDPSYTNQWSLQNDTTSQEGIDATQAWNFTTGSRSVVVAVLDSGIDFSNPDLTPNEWTNPDAGQDGFTGDVHGYNFVDDNGNVTDVYGHGTHVAGIIGADGNNGQGSAGVNWNVSLMALKTMDDSGVGYTSDAIRAINYVVTLRTDFGVNVRVINASWSGTVASPALNAAIRSAGNAGILFVTAAGNDSADVDTTSYYPAAYSEPNLIAVAAANQTGALAGFSNFGPNTVSIAAPGVSIYSTLPGNTYGYLSGTSMATPEVAGVAALAWAEDPTATVAQVRAALLNGAVRLPGLTGKVGSGLLNAYNTLQLLQATPTPTPSPTPTPTPTPVTPNVTPATSNGSPSTAAALAINSTSSGTISAIGGAAFYKVQLAAGQKYTFQTTLGTLTDTVLTLYGTDGQTIYGQNDDISSTNLASRIAFQPTTAGVYYLAVTGYAGVGKGTFTLQASGPAPTPTPAPAPTPTVPNPSIAAIGNQNVAPGGLIAISLIGTDPNGQTLHYSATAQGALAGSVTLTTIGNILMITASPSFSGNVQVVVTASDTKASTTTTFGVTVTSPAHPAVAAASVAINSADAAGLAANVKSTLRSLSPAAVNTVLSLMAR